MRYRRLRQPGGTYFFTLVTFQRRTILADADRCSLLRHAIDEVRSWHPFIVEAEVFLPDHIHSIWRLPDDDGDFSTRWRLVKQAFIRRLDRRGELMRAPDRTPMVWQKRFWEHLIRDERDFTAHVEYIHFNPVKHGLVKRPRDWQHSSFMDWVRRGCYDTDWAADAEPIFPERTGGE